jgi:hypothetical protein
MGAAIRGPAGLIDLGAEPLTIGRSRNNRLVLTNSQVSGRHAEIQPLADGRYQVIDVGSTNGTSVNGIKLTTGVPQPLNAGDTIMLGGIGGVEVRFELTTEAPWQVNQPQVPTGPGSMPFGGSGPGGFGAPGPAVPPAQPFGGGISQPAPGGPGFSPSPPDPGAFGGGGFPPGPQPAPAAPGPAFPAPAGPGPQAFPPAQGPFPAAPGGFPPPNQFGPPGGPPPQGPGFPPPGGPGFPPSGGPGSAPFGAPPQGTPGGFPQAQGFQGPPGAPGFSPPGGTPPGLPRKKRSGRILILLVGGIIVLVIIVAGIVFAVTRGGKSPSTTPTASPTKSAGTPTGMTLEGMPSREGLLVSSPHYTIVIKTSVAE